MNTITVWLLVSITPPGYINQPTLVVERFATVEECVRVQSVIKKVASHHAVTQCIQATVVKP